ncbi:sensor histidine kinase [Blautia sp.]|uniref:sensor histidine kinase n=1 Tax=Blautia sp. TaxID=1955243 RepID=UPI002E77B7D4|nr:HAMP domain-containing sensor histidine kinase [Blautia sp.]MEE0810351.1 HAMP domain-containing sensor histidine kinase [Blautia sp.]
MKTKHHLLRILLIVLGITGVLAYLFYLFMDYGVNGFFRDWFAETFIMTQEVYDASREATVFYDQVDWYALKSFLLFFLIVAVIFVVFLVLISMYVYGRIKEAKTISSLNDMIQNYRKHDLEMEIAFPKNCREIGAQMLQMKTDMQRQEQILKEESQRKSDLITYLAHDLKTPLTSVMGYLSLLDEAPDMPEAQKEKYIHIALTKAERLENLIAQFFEITQFNLHHMVLEKEHLDLAYMLMQMAEEFYPILSAHGNTVDLQVDETLAVYGDGDKLARVFNNILKNAVAYSYESSVIVIRGYFEQGMAVISFENHGKTIPKQKLDLIFEKFFRLDEARRSNTGGAGLGLAIAREIVELHKGSISAQSQEEKTTFQVRLPVETP